ncbi:MAG: SUMF1/EgtB/PvdO family nonheme iron enzyme, partial [bacterium]|nr:SUMF1/EgtB/PvdO family nonheme iron enzyme [bacterium]
MRLLAGLLLAASLAAAGGPARGAAGGLCASGPGLIRIPAGTFWAGSGRAERDYGYRIGSPAARKWKWYDNWEQPRRQIKLPAFSIGKNLVTQRDYQRFVRETGHPAPFISKPDYQRQGYLVHPYKSVRRYLWGKDAAGRPIHLPGLGAHPVVLVSRADAGAYCEWRGKQAGASYRLPTEGEWEKAARGDNGRYFPWGNRFDPKRLNSGYRHQGTTPVGMFPGGASP